MANGNRLPTTWNVEKLDNILWKTAIPGLAHSSPIIWENRIFVTTAIASDAKGVLRIGQVSAMDLANDTSRQSWRIYCLDRTSGKILWEKTAQEDVPRVRRHPKSTHASATPATDGRYVVSLFASGGLYCFDFTGNLLWNLDLGVLDTGAASNPDVQWGPASSPIIFRNLVIVQCDIQKDSFITAFDLATGKRVWKTVRQVIPSWSSPTVYVGQDHTELITNGTEHIMGYDPMTGRELWKLHGTSLISIPTPFIADGLIYVTSGYRREIQPIYAILPGSSGDISLKEGSSENEQIVWSTLKGGPYITTPIVYENYLYVCGYDGILDCYQAKTGEQIYQERLGQGGFFSSSPVAGDGKLYFTSEEGDVYVVKAGPKFELLATNHMSEACLATPAISDGTIIIRTETSLYGIGER